jgi:hypothetical protein
MKDHLFSSNWVAFRAVLLLVLISGATIHEGVIAITGREEGLWTKDGTFVIVATIKAVERVHGPEYDPTHRLVLLPHAALAGSFDPSLHVELVAHVAVGHGSSVRQTPPVGSLAVVVMRPHEGAFWVDSASCAFVPGGSALTVVASWNDPRIAETLRKIQAARANPNPSPYGKPGTQPATTQREGQESPLPRSQ